MRKGIHLLLALLLIASLFCACGKEAAAPEETTPTTVSTTPSAQTTAATQETIPETEPPTEPSTEPGVNAAEIIIGSEIYTFPISARELTDNGWEIVSYSETFDEVDSMHVSFVRDDLGFDADITGRVGGSIHDNSVKLENAFFYSGEGSAFAAVASSIFPGMSYDDVAPTLDSIGYNETQVYETGSGFVVVAYHTDYAMEIHCSPEQVNAIIVSDR